MSTETPIMRKIRLLMAKAQGTNNEHEAAAFAAKVQELLLEHGLAVSDIAASSPSEAREKVAEHDAAPGGGKNYLKSPARKALLQAVCRFYMCSYLRWGNERLVIVGKRTNAEVAASMMEYLLAQTVRLSNRYGRENGLDMRAVTDFRRGCMLKLVDRLNTMTLERERAARGTSNPGNLPAVFVSESQQVRDYMSTLTLKKARPLNIRQGIHAVAGRQAAKDISLSPQVGQQAQQRRIR